MKKHIYTLLFFIACVIPCILTVAYNRYEDRKIEKELLGGKSKSSEIDINIRTNKHMLFMHSLKIDSLKKSSDFDYEAYADVEYGIRYFTIGESKVDLDSNYKTRARGHIYINKDTIVIVVVNKK